TKAVVSAVQGHEENAVKSSACWIWRPTEKVIDHISKDSGSYMPKRFDYVDPPGRLKSVMDWDQGIFDSRCSRHMTGNKSCLTDYQDIDGGFVAFAGSPKVGKITRKGKIRTGKLDFEDVYFVKELKFNLFLVSQMCDKKNNVLFTKTECLILSPDFKLLDESQVLLKVPRQNNMYSFFNLKNVVPSGVAERKNKTLIEAAKTMLADSLLPTVHNRVLIIKPHNKTPYEILTSRSPNLDFMRLFGCPVTILNTLDYLGKCEGMTAKGFLVGYSINSKAFRVFNTRTMKVKENLHVKFLENKSNVVGSGPEWLFDINSLTKSMNYKPVTVGNQTNDDAGSKSSEDEFVDDAGKKNEVQDPAKEESERLVGQGEATNTNSTNRLNTISPSVSAVGQSFDNDDLPTDPFMPDLEDTTSIFIGAYDDENMGAEADLNNLETTMNVSPIPTTIIHKDHPKE
ncbi:ribonuclease H-like domain-containing protein, partial [Tanacetum coccineum]